MWISRLAYQNEHNRITEAEAIVSVLQSHNTALQTTMDWMRMRLTQLEHERAALIFNYMGVKIPVPVIEEAAEPADARQALHEAISFDDMGNDEASRQGVDWNEHGEVVYSRKK